MWVKSGVDELLTALGSPLHGFRGLSGATPAGEDIAPEVLLVVASMSLGAVLLLTAWMWAVHQHTSAKEQARLLNPELGEEGPAPQRECSNLELVALTSPTLAYSCTAATLAFMLLPDESRTFSYDASWTLGLLFTVAGIAELPGPLIGHMSDCFCSPYGRRRPFILLSTVVVVGATSMQWLGAIHQSLFVYAAALLVHMLAWALLYAAQQGLVLDILKPAQLSIASTYQAIFIAGGAIIAFGAAVAIPAQLHYHYQYAVCAVLAVVTSLMALAFHEPPSVGHGVAEAPTSFYGLVKRFYFLDFESQYDFSLLMVCKVLMIGGGIAKGYLIYWLRDTWNVTDTDKLHRKVGGIAIAAELTALATAGLLLLVGGDTLSPSRTAAIGALWIAATWVILIPLGFWSEGFKYAEMIAVTYGIGHGLVLVGDQVLTYRTIPNKAHSSRSFGLQSVATFVGMCVFSLVCSLLLYLFGRVWQIRLPGHRAGTIPSDGYRLEGYIALFVFAIIANFIWACVYSRVGQSPAKTRGGKWTLGPEEESANKSGEILDPERRG